MTAPAAQSPQRIAIACGGTGGHLFPGVAVAQELQRRGCHVTLLLSEKEVDRQAAESVPGVEIAFLPAAGLSAGALTRFVRGFARSWMVCRRRFVSTPPTAVLGMGGFTAGPPIVAAKSLGVRAFLHESNTIPGRANRWLARFADGAFVGFPEAAQRLGKKASVTGTPVRPQFAAGNAAACCRALGLDPERPVLLVMGGSQGAAGVNRLLIDCSRGLAARIPDLQVIHLSGKQLVPELRAAYASAQLTAQVYEFLDRMELVMGAATVAISRAGASSLAEIAAVRLPAVLIPYPFATDNHQHANARAFERTGAAFLVDEKGASTGAVVSLVCDLLQHPEARANMQCALAQWHRPEAAAQIAEGILSAAAQRPATRRPTRLFSTAPNRLPSALG